MLTDLKVVSDIHESCSAAKRQRAGKSIRCWEEVPSVSSISNCLLVYFRDTIVYRSAARRCDPHHRKLSIGPSDV